ncbi:hypothetical protein L3X39_01470 [Sabulilitoribacter multivorans]|uniref:Uncharacterized protein n=1 Tax=Flaviramulus multivorans TaxID=1304750 RepID=A0ABS9IFB0_9FLAO|nr:hypothetical protein [Flaviramulus multivorans]MCF7559290.1 hypothetical protein [Flaviramulus multivorans]
MSKLQLTFGIPKDGWLPTNLKISDFELEFVISNIHENPTDKMCDALILCLKGAETEFQWNLEPDIYFFKLTPIRNLIKLSILESDESKVQNQIYEFNGDFNSVILPMYRSLKKFTTLEFDKTDWEKIVQIKLNKLTELIAERKNYLQQRV